MKNDYEGGWEYFKLKIRKEFTKSHAENVENFISQIEPCFLDYFVGHRKGRRRGGEKLVTRIVNQLTKVVYQADKFVLAHEKSDDLRGELHAYLSGSRVGFGFDILNDFIECDILPPKEDVRPLEGEETHDNEVLKKLLSDFQGAIRKTESIREKLIKSIKKLGEIDERSKLELAYYSKPNSPTGTGISSLAPFTILDAGKCVLDKYSGMKEGYPLIDSFRRAWMASFLPEIEIGDNSIFITYLTMAFGYSDDARKLKSLAQQYREIYNKK